MEISEDYKELSEFISQIPSCFSSSGEVLYKSRNEIRMIETDGRWLVVKKFCNKGIIKQIIRSLGTSKGRRSFCNARYLFEYGIKTLEVPTQKANTDACRWYEKNGFTIQSCTQIYHWWL